MAPAADLIIVKAARQNTGSVSFREDDTTNALSFIQTKAAELNEPFVVNMSLGGQAGPHDGTTGEERAIDNLVGGGAGRAIHGRLRHRHGQFVRRVVVEVYELRP